MMQILCAYQISIPSTKMPPHIRSGRLRFINIAAFGSTPRLMHSRNIALRPPQNEGQMSELDYARPLM
jgi:hypothetical protein